MLIFQRVDPYILYKEVEMEKIDLFATSSYVITMRKRGEVVEDGAVAVKDGEIIWIGKKEEGEKLFDPQRRIEGGYSIMTPGFINTHTHAAMVAFRGLADDLPLMKWLKEYIWPSEGKWVTREFIKTVLPLAIIEMFRTGITTYADMYFFQDEAARIAREMGIRAVLGEGLIDFETPSFKNPKDALSFTKDFIEEWKNDGMIIPAVAPHAPYSCSKDLLLSSSELAEKYDVPCLIHIAETQEEVNEIKGRYGETPVKFLEKMGFFNENVVAAHSVWLEEEEIDIYKNYGVGVSHNPTSNLKLASGIAPVREYLLKGVKIGIGTDGAASNNNLDFIEEMHITALIHKVKSMDPTSVDAWDVLYMATLGGARVLGLERVGSLEPGKRADFVIFDLEEPHLTPLYNPVSHLVYSAKSSDIKYVVVEGCVKLDKGEFPDFSLDEIIHKVRELGKSIRSS
jgi:5-methylthioadenosine/S-adenosylhomocysteine deaminase